MPGRVLTHQESFRMSRPSETMEPQAGVGGGTPAPRKLNVDSSRITVLTWRVAMTITVLRTPGRRWVTRMRMVKQPATRARAM